MKTKFKYFTLSLVALLMVGFSSCSNDDDVTVDTEDTKTVFLKISNEQPDTRAEGDAVAGETTVTFTKGHLYFTDVSGNILRYHSIGEGKDFTVGDLTTGKSIDKLSKSVTQVYIVGNTESAPKLGNISAVKAEVLAVETQGDITNVNLYGEQTSFTGSTPNFTAEVNLAPTVSRIELAGITGSGRISSFDVEGIFIDNYYSEAKVDGTISTLVSHGTEPKIFSGDNTNGKYGITASTASSSNIYDWYTTAKPAGSLIAKPNSGVWGYNLFAASNAVVPRIVIRLSNIEVTEGPTFTGPQFITIKGFKNTTGVETKIDNFKPGNIYKIAATDMVFDETNLTPQPNMETIDVKVTVTLAKWNAVSLKPIL